MIDVIWCDMMLYHGHYQGTSLKMCFLTKPLREALVFAASKSSHGNLKIIKLKIQKKTPLWNLQMPWDFRPLYRITYLSISIPFFEDFVASLFCLVGTLGEGPGIRRQHLTCWEAVWRPIVQQENLPHNMCIQIHSYVCLGENVQILAYKNQCVL